MAHRGPSCPGKPLGPSRPEDLAGDGCGSWTPSTASTSPRRRSRNALTSWSTTITKASLAPGAAHAASGQDTAKRDDAQGNGFGTSIQRVRVRQRSQEVGGELRQVGRANQVVAVEIVRSQVQRIGRGTQERRDQRASAALTVPSPSMSPSSRKKSNLLDDSPARLQGEPVFSVGRSTASPG